MAVKGEQSERRKLAFGVPQGSVLGSILFTTYTQPLSAVIAKYGLKHHLYADDSQIYVAFRPKDAASGSTIIQHIENCVTEIKRWMTSHFLKLNGDKTEVLVISTPAMSRYIPPIVLQVGGSAITPSGKVRDLGVTLDPTLQMEQHVLNVCKTTYYQLHNIFRIRKYLTVGATRTLVHALVTSMLDYCNSLLFGIPERLIARLQRVQNTAARLITATPRVAHITPVRRELHWLPITHRINYKILLLTFKSLRGLAPEYLAELLQRYNPSRVLRSGSQDLLVEPSFKLKTLKLKTPAPS